MADEGQEPRSTPPKRSPRRQPKQGIAEALVHGTHSRKRSLTQPSEVTQWNNSRFTIPEQLLSPVSRNTLGQPTHDVKTTPHFNQQV